MSSQLLTLTLTLQHILSPLRPTFAPELQSIDEYFPTLSSYPALSERSERAARDARVDDNKSIHVNGSKATDATPTSTASTDPITNLYLGEGLGRSRGLRIGTRGSGKRSVKGRKGEGRVDEVGGYWWWEVGWG